MWFIAVPFFVCSTLAGGDVLDAGAIQANLPSEGPPFTSSPFARSFRRSPDGSKIAFFDAVKPDGAPDLPGVSDADRLDGERARALYRVVVTKRDGGERDELTDAIFRLDDAEGPEWRADGGALAVTTSDAFRRETSIVVIDVAARTSKALAEEKSGPFRAPAWSHAGARLAAVQLGLVPQDSSQRDANLVVFDADGKRTTSVALPKSEFQVATAWSPDDSLIAVLCGNHVVTVAVATGDVTDFGAASCAEAGWPKIRFSADGNRFILPNDRGLTCADVATHSLKTIEMNGVAQELAFVPGTNAIALAIVTRPEQSLRDAASALAHAGDGQRHYIHIPTGVNVGNGIVAPLRNLRWTDARRYLWIEDHPQLAATICMWSR